jgi:hypothetical protein
LNKWRIRSDHKAAAKPARGDDTDKELTSAADDIYAEALKHRANVIKRDLAAKARRSKNRG